MPSLAYTHPQQGVSLYKLCVGWAVYYGYGVWRCLNGNKLNIVHALFL